MKLESLVDDTMVMKWGRGRKRVRSVTMAAKYVLEGVFLS